MTLRFRSRVETVAVSTVTKCALYLPLRSGNQVLYLDWHARIIRHVYIVSERRGSGWEEGLEDAALVA